MPRELPRLAYRHASAIGSGLGPPRYVAGVDGGRLLSMIRRAARVETACSAVGDLESRPFSPSVASNDGRPRPAGR